MSEKDETFSDIEAFAADLEYIQTDVRSIEQYIQTECSDEYAEIEKLLKLTTDIQVQIDGVHASMEEKEQEAFKDLAQARRDAAHKETLLKHACYSLPIDKARTGKKLIVGNLRITIAKSTTKVTYSEDLLDDHPEYYELYVDGDPLVRRAIDPSVMGRLVANGDIPESHVAPYKSETRLRNPAVRITEYVTDD